MFENLKKINESLFYKYSDIENNIKTFNRAVFVVMQSFCEEYIKDIIRNLDFKIKLTSKETLGSLISNRVIIRVLETKYGIHEFDYFSYINNYGNQYKHSKTSVLDEEEIFKYFTFIGKLIGIKLTNEGLEVGNVISRNYFSSLTTDLEIQDINTSKQDEELVLLRKEIESLQNQQKIMNQNLLKIEKENESIKTLKFKQNELRNQIAVENRILEEYEASKAKIIIFKRNNSDVIDENLQKELDLICDNSLSTEIKIMNLSEELEEVSDKLKFDKTNANENKYRTVIEELQGQIIEMQMKINDQSSNKIPNRITRDMSFDKRQKAINAIRFSLSNTLFTSNYIDNSIFTITNLTQLKDSKSEYKSYYAVIYNILNRGKIITPSNYIKENTSNDRQKKIVYQLQMVILSVLKEGSLQDKEWRINICKEYVNLLEYAVQDILHWVEVLVTLASKKFSRPKIEINKDDACITIEFNTLSNSSNVYVINDGEDDSNNEPVWIERKIEYKIIESLHSSLLTEVLEYLFGFKSFREGQIPILINFLKLRNTIGILPTGGGKSLVYYLAILMQPKVSLIIAPINSLIKDQNDKLKRIFNIDRIANLTSDNENMLSDLDAFSKSKVLFTFASPERAQSKKFRDILISHSYNKTIGSVILDEVHCLSEWGHDFRVPYLMLSETLNHYCEGINYLGLTATASVSVVKDLQIELKINANKDVIFSEALKRENLNFKIQTTENIYSMKRDLNKLLTDNFGKGTKYDITPNNNLTNTGIVFAKTINDRNAGVNALYNSLSFTFPNIIGKFYGDYKQEQDIFMNNTKSLLVATKAFGMGVDKPNVRFTVHFGMPSSREGFYQEAGRAGRDNRRADCLLYSYENSLDITRKIERFLNVETPINELHKLRNELSFKSDISTNFFFLTQDLEIPEVEAKNATILYNKIASQLRSSKLYTLEVEKKQKTKNEKYLYLLHKLGIVHNWHVNWFGHSVSLQVEVNDRFNDIEHIKERTYRYMMPYSPNKRIVEFIDNITKIEQLPDLILHVRKWYHNTFIRARREQLSNMYYFVKKYKNMNASNEIQEVMDEFFDLTELIGLTEEGFDLTFKDNNYTEIIQYAFEIEVGRLDKLRITLERLLESVVNSKVDIFTGLIALRVGSFDNDRNGRKRLEFGLEELELDDLEEVFTGFNLVYKSLNVKNKLRVINTTSKYINNIADRLFNSNPNDPILQAIQISKLNNATNKLWRK